MDSDGNTYVEGMSHDASGLPVIRAQKYSVTGQVVWDRVYSPPGVDTSGHFMYFTNAVLTSNRHLVIFSEISYDNRGTFWTHQYLLELNPDGTKANESNTQVDQADALPTITKTDDIYSITGSYTGDNVGGTYRHYRAVIHHEQGVNEAGSRELTESDLGLGNHPYTYIYGRVYADPKSSQHVFVGYISYNDNGGGYYTQLGVVCFLNGVTPTHIYTYPQQMPSHVAFDSRGNVVVVYDGNGSTINSDKGQYGFMTYTKDGTLSQTVAFPAASVPDGFYESMGARVTLDGQDNIYVSYAAELGGSPNAGYVSWDSLVAKYSTVPGAASLGIATYATTPTWTTPFPSATHTLAPSGNGWGYTQFLAVNNVGKVCLAADDVFDAVGPMRWLVMDSFNGAPLNGASGEGFIGSQGYITPSFTYTDSAYPVGLCADPYDGFVIGGDFQHDNRYDRDFHTLRTLGRPSNGIDIFSDTNRDGTVSASDNDYTAANWSWRSGAYIGVNYDTSNPGTSDPVVPDAISMNDNGDPQPRKSATLESADVGDITPIQIHIDPTLLGSGGTGGTGQALTPGNHVVLRLPTKIRNAVHVFNALAAGASVIYGGYDESRDQVDITSLFNASGDATLGAEALYFAGLPVKYQPSSIVATVDEGAFEGFVKMDVAVVNASGADVKTGHLEMRVTPFILLPNSQPSQNVWVEDGRNFGFQSNTALVNSLASSQRELVANGDYTNQWIQDHMEIGYYQRPGKSPVMATFRLPYGRFPNSAQNGTQNPTWPINKSASGSADHAELSLQGAGKGTFSILSRFYGDSRRSGNFGGNIECLPPTTKNPLGTIVVGNTARPEILAFFKAQQAQPLVEIDTDWLSVGHVDEAFAVSPDGNVYVANTAQGLSDLQARSTANDDAPLFLKGAGTYANMNVASFTYDGTNLAITLRRTSGSGPIDAGYFRVMAGPSEGYCFHLTAAHTEDGNQQREYVCDGSWNGGHLMSTGDSGNVGDPGSVLGAVLNSGYFASKAVFTAGLNDMINHSGAFVADGCTQCWNAINTQGNLVSGCPSFIRASEVLNDPNFAPQQSAMQAKIDADVQLMKDVGGIDDSQIKLLPALYIGQFNAVSSNLRGLAFVPDLANYQVANGNSYVGSPFVALPASSDPFVTAAASILINGVFVDNWSLYHAEEGGVHCGTNVWRTPFDSWWNKVNN